MLLQGVLMRSTVFASGAGLIAAGVAARAALREVDRDALGVLIAPWLLALSILATRAFPAESARPSTSPDT